MTVLTFRALRLANRARDVEWDPDRKIDRDFRVLELWGEVGELCNVVKKMYREKLGLRGSRATLDELADEIGDVAICTDLHVMQDEILPGDFRVTDQVLVRYPDYPNVTAQEICKELAGYTNSMVNAHRQSYLRIREHATFMLFGNLSLLASIHGLDIALCISGKFNRTSQKQGLSTMLLP